MTYLERYSKLHGFEFIGAHQYLLYTCQSVDGSGHVLQLVSGEVKDTQLLEAVNVVWQQCYLVVCQLQTVDGVSQGAQLVWEGCRGTQYTYVALHVWALTPLLWGKLLIVQYNKDNYQPSKSELPDILY